MNTIPVNYLNQQITEDDQNGVIVKNKDGDILTVNSDNSSCQKCRPKIIFLYI